MNLIWTQSIVNKMLKTPVYQREQLASRYNLTDQIPTSDEDLRYLQHRPKEMWKRAKQVLTKSSKQVFKWWTSTRYQGHTRSYGIIKCTCDNRTTLTQQHIIDCPRFRECYTQTAAIHNVEVPEIKDILQERKEDYNTEDISEINIMERTLSEKLTNVIGTFEGPRIARRARY